MKKFFILSIISILLCACKKPVPVSVLAPVPVSITCVGDKSDKVVYFNIGEKTLYNVTIDLRSSYSSEAKFVHFRLEPGERGDYELKKPRFDLDSGIVSAIISCDGFKDKKVNF